MAVKYEGISFMEQNRWTKSYKVIFIVNFKHSDWLVKIFKPIRVLNTR